MVAGATAISTAAPSVGYAAIDAAVHNIQNIACIDHTKQYFVCESMQLWYISHYCIDVWDMVLVLLLVVLVLMDIWCWILVICVVADMGCW